MRSFGVPVPPERTVIITATASDVNKNVVKKEK
jgi:hypothetical protein